MHSQNLVLIACRLCALLFAGIAMAATAIGALALYWAVFGLPEDLAPQFEDDLPSQAQFLMAMLGAIAVVVGLFHATLSVPAALGRIWAVVVGTLFLGACDRPTSRTDVSRGLADEHDPPGLLLDAGRAALPAACPLSVLALQLPAGVDYAGSSCRAAAAGAATGRRPMKQKPSPYKASLLRRIFRPLWVIVTLTIWFSVGLSAPVLYYIDQTSRDLPNYASLAKYEPAVMTRVYAYDGSLIGEYARERRIFMPISSVPKLTIAAFLSAEDRRFYDHGGIDYLGILRALLNNLQNFGTKRPEGASTITQQVAKNFLLSSDQNVDRKLKEAMLALRIERTYSKDKILELYLNEIFLGVNSYGVAAAALNYFNKELSELTIEEAAYLAALPKGPNNYHPLRKTKEATARRDWIISQMADAGYITPEQAAAAKAKPLKVNLASLRIAGLRRRLFRRGR